MGKKFILLLLLTTPLFSSIYAQKRFSRSEYIDKYKEIAISNMKSHGIPASITLAQGCLESGDGNSSLAIKANNHFGIKCHKDWKGESIRQDDDESNECFRKYKKAEESFEDHADFIRYRDRYAFLFDLDPTDYKGWCYGLKKAGYATHPKYAQMLINIIEEFDLTRFDKELIPSSPSVLEELKVLNPAKSSPLYKYSQGRTIYLKNNTAYIIASENDTYGSIAIEYNLFTKEILRFNDLDKDQSINPGTIVYIEKKKNKGERHLTIHIAEKGDTYYDISQRYGVKLSKILKYNGVKDKSTPSEGDKVYLRKK